MPFVVSALQFCDVSTSCKGFNNYGYVKSSSSGLHNFGNDIVDNYRFTLLCAGFYIKKPGFTSSTPLPSAAPPATAPAPALPAPVTLAPALDLGAGSFRSPVLGVLPIGLMNYTTPTPLSTWAVGHANVTSADTAYAQSVQLQRALSRVRPCEDVCGVGVFPFLALSLSLVWRP